MKISVVVRTYNESRYLPDLLAALPAQKRWSRDCEIIVVDSGSTDGTQQIAVRGGARIVEMDKEQFSFGRSLNLGCEAARGSVIAIISGHCVPIDERWLGALTDPLQLGRAQYVYGRQVGGVASKYSEVRTFERLYGRESFVPQRGFFCNNANAAILKRVWEEHQFDEELPGLEDMELAKRLQKAGHAIGYVANATVGHYHHESWAQIRRRYEREAIALQRVMPEIHLSLLDVFELWSRTVFQDCGPALKDGRFPSRLIEIVRFRWNQHWGSYCGNQITRSLSREQKRQYFYSENGR